MYKQGITIRTMNGTRAVRTGDDAKAWLARVNAIHKRARAALIAHGATADDLDDYLETGMTRTARLASAWQRFSESLTDAQWAAIRPAACGVNPWQGTVADLFDGCRVSDGSVRCFDEAVPLAEVLWPA
jgi:hypothetical protein